MREASAGGSTTLSEHIAPEVWLRQLNEYLTQMSAAVFEHDGYLDKFMGDGIMAVWNTFGSQENHAAAAVSAGLQMLRRLEALNTVWQQMPDRTPLRIGIGVHTGDAIVGNVGSDERTQFTVIGDVVNTAARIEALTKEHGVAFIITEATADRARGLLNLREIGTLGFLMFFVFWVGFNPKPLLNMMDSSVDHLLQQVETGVQKGSLVNQVVRVKTEGR